MVEHDRRRVLKRTGLATVGATLAAASTSSASAETGTDTTGASTTTTHSAVGADTTVTETAGWPSIGGTPGNNPVVEPAAEPEPPVYVAWEYEHAGPTAIVDDTVYLTTDGEVHALDAADGALEWATHNIGASGTPAVRGDTVLVGGERLTLIDAADGEICCQHDLGYDGALASPVVAGDYAFTVGDGTLFAFDIDPREVAWEFTPTADTDEHEPLYEQPVAVGGGAVVAVSESHAVAFELEDGTKRWRVDDPVGDDEYSRFMEPNPRQTSYPVATDEVVAIGSVDTGDASMWPLGYTTLYDVETGERRVTSERSTFDPGAITDERFYALDSHNVRGYDRDSGEESWDPSSITYRVPSIAVGDGIVYAGLTLDGAGYDPDEDDVPEHYDGVYAFDADTGEIEWSVGTDGIPHIALANETVYASSETLVALRSENDDWHEEEADTADDEGGDESDDTTDEAAGEEESEDTTSEESETDTDNDTGTDTDADTGTDTDADTGTDNETENNSTGSADGNGGTNETADKSTESEADSNDNDNNKDGTPGFTAGAGVLGAGATLEWLRRRAGGGSNASGGTDRRE
ncbi:PQQ repeat protein [Natrialba magadii ATCC 43099]|uniref:PQQ repeat protein n=1 Tax=Natrialba magadii (strain ATCC 43099 / DSM 3394 / CCM 3739 / CIP 104546 / IAM 13178 / JCM 8861 / NBRC 102185 / NCIMB 2190 / MS3) TaxID=547559 RepID=D3SVJ6_NATMM|nr:PQQ-binding-like beta-propeller repeat protein [Natrialba magadii]ADD05604.1 PQQ repeat protein [Natrialba magadii ATCC 43099]ELY29983.1 pyrrolo-quinoline quinone [Natrialba magadii ATCC 43099]